MALARDSRRVASSGRPMDRRQSAATSGCCGPRAWCMYLLLVSVLWQKQSRAEQKKKHGGGADPLPECQMPGDGVFQGMIDCCRPSEVCIRCQQQALTQSDDNRRQRH